MAAPATIEARPITPRRPAKRFAVAAAFSTLFFAGAAFTAGAGDQMARLMDEDAAALEAADVLAGAVEAPAAEEPAPEAPAAEVPAAEIPAAEVPVPAEAPAASAPAEMAPSTAAAHAAEQAAATAPVDAPSPDDVVAPAPAQPEPAAQPAAAPQPAAGPKPAPAAKPKGTKQWVVKRAAAPPAQAPEVEHEHSGEATVWLNRTLPDPTPASARLTRSFAKQLVSTSKRHGADWAAILGVLRAQGERGAVPATAGELDTLAGRMAGTDAWKGALALSGRTGLADRASALADLYRFAGVEALITGFAAAKDRLAAKALATEGVLIYGAGRSDIASGRIDVRIILLIGYLAERHESVTVSSLFSGHRMFSRPGVVSAHMYGHAVDIAAVGGSSILGNSSPGGITEETVRSILLLPSELQPRQVISLLGLGGPSFPMRDHADHIHVGY